MESMTQPRSDSNRDELELALNDLKAYVATSAQEGIAAHEAEAGIWQRVLQLGHRALGLLFRQMDRKSGVWRGFILGCISRSLGDLSWSGWCMAPAKGKRLRT